MLNQIKTTILLAVMTALILWIGQLLGGRQGMVIALAFAAVMNFSSYWFSDRIVLSMYRAREVSTGQNPELHEIVRTLSQRAGLPLPKIYIVPQQAPNAFATGRNPEHAVVAVTEGLLQLMNREEIMGVLAHELSHVKDRDILISSIAATMAGAIMLLATMARWSMLFGGYRGSDENRLGGIGMLVMSILAPLAAMLIQMAISRSREYLADKTGAQIVGNPEGLARALEKLGAYSGRLPMQANPSTAHMFIVNPLSGGSLANLFSTHPPLAERIARLRGQKQIPGSKGPDSKAEDRMETEARSAWDRLSR